MLDIIDRYYRGNKAKTYEKTRSQSPKWQFEEDTLQSTLKQLRSEVHTIIDAPVGTGRFLEKYSELGPNVHVTGLDYSSDMLEIASAKNHKANADLVQQDIINSRIAMSADLVVCYRFLNLIPLTEAIQTLDHLLSASRKYALLTIRIIEDDYAGETYIEDKIHLHRRGEISRVIADNSFEIATAYEFDDLRVGQYTILLCRRVSKIA